MSRTCYCFVHVPVQKICTCNYVYDATIQVITCTNILVQVITCQIFIEKKMIACTSHYSTMAYLLFTTNLSTLNKRHLLLSAKV